MSQILEALARDLEASAQIDLARCFSDGTFVVAKKDQPAWERPDAAAVRSSWALQTLMVFHSPCTRLLLEHLKSPLAALPSMRPSVWDTPDVLSGIVPVRVLRSIREEHGAPL